MGFFHQFDDGLDDGEPFLNLDHRRGLEAHRVHELVPFHIGDEQLFV